MFINPKNIKIKDFYFEYKIFKNNIIEIGL